MNKKLMKIIHQVSALLLIAAMLLGIVPVDSWIGEVKAAAVTEGDWEYEITTSYEAGTGAHITGYQGSSSVVVIPDTLGGETVVAVSNPVFKQNLQVASVVVPDSVVYIAAETFKESNLKTVSLGNSLKSIENSLFHNSQLEGEIQIPNSVTKIGDNAFRNSKISKVNFGNQVKTIGVDAFSFSKNLTKVIIPDSVETLGRAAFFYCTNLTSVKIGNSLKTINNQTFSYCNLTELILPDSLETISDHVFEYNSALTEVTLPKSLKRMESGAFRYCTALTKVTLPDSLEEIGLTIFQGCTNLKSVKLGNKVNKISYLAFESCAIEELELPDSVQTIDLTAFNNCKVKKVTLDTVTSAFNFQVLNGVGQYLETLVVPNRDFVMSQEDEFPKNDFPNLKAICGYEGTPFETQVIEKGISFIPLGKSLTIALQENGQALSGISVTDELGQTKVSNQGGIVKFPISDYDSEKKYTFVIDINGYPYQYELTGSEYGVLDFYNARVKVTRNNVPLANAQVTIKEYVMTETTDADGIAEFLFIKTTNAYGVEKLLSIKNGKTYQILETCQVQVEYQGKVAGETTEFLEEMCNGNVNFELNPSENTTAPTISGPVYTILPEGYQATATSAYRITGSAEVKVEKVSGNEKITWNDSDKKLHIGAGLVSGNYVVKLRASNGTKPDAELTFTLIIYEKQITPPPVKATVKAVLITSKITKVTKGKTVTFKSSISGQNNPSKAVKWSVAGKKKSGTKISAAGKLQVAANETAKKLSVTATSAIDKTKVAKVTFSVVTPKTATPTNKVIALSKKVTKDQKITLKAPKSTTLYYTTNGKKPTTKSKKVKAGKSVKINITKKTVVKVFAVKKYALASKVLSRTYQVK
jgi:hypothetical protein